MVPPTAWAGAWRRAPWRRSSPRSGSSERSPWAAAPAARSGRGPAPSAGGGAGAASGAWAGHVSGGMRRDDLRELGEVLDEGRAGLIVVYATNVADQIAANIKAANRIVSKATDMAADELAREIREVESSAPASV